MKKILILILILVIVGVGYYYISSRNSQYSLSLNSEINYADRHFENMVSENAKLYWKENNSFSVNTGSFKDKETSATEISRFVSLYNPAMINMNGKYVYYKEQGTSHLYFYQSGDKILMVTSSASKDSVDSFILWLNKSYKPI